MTSTHFQKLKRIPTTYQAIIKSMMKVALPISLQMVLVAALQLIDNFFIGYLKNAETVAAGVNAINNIAFIISSLVIGFINGVGVYMIHSSASSNANLQHNIFRIKLLWMFILLTILILPSLIFLKQIASLWVPTNSHEALNFASDYGQIVLPSLALGMIVIVFANTLKESQIVKITVYISIIAVLINSVLNYVFMYALNMGIKGAAIATIVARSVEVLIWLFYFIIKKPTIIPPLKTWFSVSYKKLFVVFPKCFLWMINQFLLSLSFTIQILILSRVSISAGASLNSAGAILQLFRAFIIGYAQALSIMVIYFISLNNKLQLKWSGGFKIYFQRISILSFCFGLIVGIICSLLSPLMFLIYPKYNYETNLNSIIMIVAASLAMSVNLLCDVPISALKGTGVSKRLIVFDALFGWFITLPIVIALAYINGGLLTYGWIYFIASLTIILKPFSLFRVAIKTIQANKKLELKGLYGK